MEITNEILLIIGIMFTALGLLGSVISVVVFKIKKIKLWAKYDREYGISE